MTNQTNEFLITFTGKEFHPFNPHPDEICIEDIAHALARICRYGGHTRAFYSVAQHSVLMMRQSIFDNQSEDVQRMALMHDAAEAYVGDMIRPLKRWLPQFKELEEKIFVVIAAKFRLKLGVKNSELAMLNTIEKFDLRMIATERRDLIRCGASQWGKDVEQSEPFAERITHWLPSKAENQFLKESARLGLMNFN